MIKIVAEPNKSRTTKVYGRCESEIKFHGKECSMKFEQRINIYWYSICSSNLGIDVNSTDVYSNKS